MSGHSDARSLRFRAARLVSGRLPPLIAQRARDLIYPRSAAVLDGTRFTVRTVTGSRFSGNTADHVAYPVAVNGYFNWRNVAIARAVCRPGDAIVEIGANLGTETVSFSDIVGRTGAVYAFEPYPPNLAALETNVANTRNPNVRVFPIALSDRESTARFVVPPEQNSGSGHLLGSDEQQHTAAELAEVPCQTLDSMFDQLRAPRLIVIDAEGHESAILKGAGRALAQRPVIVLEVIAELLARSGSSPEQVATRLAGFDYDLFEIRRFGLIPFAARREELPTASDWIAVPRSERKLVGRIRRTLTRAGALPPVPILNPLSGPRRRSELAL